MQHRTITKALLAIIAVIATGVVSAANVPEGWSLPTVAHEGTRVMTAGGETVESYYRYAPPGKQREEMSHEGMSMAIILRQDLGVVWTLLPGNMYMEMALDDAEIDGPATPSAEGIVEFEELGTEEMNGWPTTRYRVVSMEDGEEADGYFWITEHWIPVRMEMTIRGDSPDEKMIMNIRDLRIRDQDPNLFELPAGATNMSGMGGFTGMMSGDLFDAAASDDDDEEEMDAKDALREGLRGLFGR